MIGIIIIALIGSIIIAASLFLFLSPQFGKTPNKEQKAEYAKLENHKNGKFNNQHLSPVGANFWKILKELTARAPNRNPKKNIETEELDIVNITHQNENITQLIWFGHSTFLILIDGKKILIDPMFGNTPSPISLFGAKRYSKNLPIDIEELPFIDAVILSHDHYDHLDYSTIKRLKGKVGQYFTPLGVDNHLIKWGVAKEKINSLNWWDSITISGINLICTPARHFSGRGLFDRSTTLWCSWVIQGNKNNIFFSGDSGYDTHFKEIGKKYGPFDISLMECGQYNENWKLLHMTPEESIQASIDLQSKQTLPIHWGAFTLAFHNWTDPIERVLIKANELNIPISTPKIGAIVTIGDTALQTENWWTTYLDNPST